MPIDSYRVDVRAKLYVILTPLRIAPTFLAENYLGVVWDTFCSCKSVNQTLSSSSSNNFYVFVVLFLGDGASSGEASF